MLSTQTQSRPHASVVLRDVLAAYFGRGVARSGADVHPRRRVEFWRERPLEQAAPELAGHLYPPRPAGVNRHLGRLTARVARYVNTHPTLAISAPHGPAHYHRRSLSLPIGSPAMELTSHNLRAFLLDPRTASSAKQATSISHPGAATWDRGPALRAGWISGWGSRCGHSPSFSMLKEGQVRQRSTNIHPF